MIGAAALLLAAGCGDGQDTTTDPGNDPLVTYSRSGGIAGIEERLLVDRGGRATVSIGGGSPTSFTLSDSELGRLEAALQAADLAAVTDRETGCADCFRYEVTYDGTTVAYDEVAEPPPSVAAVVSQLGGLVAEHSPAGGAAAGPGG